MHLERDDGSNIDVTAILGKFEKMKARLRSLADIKKYCKNIDIETLAIRSTSKDLEEDIYDLVKMIETDLRKPGREISQTIPNRQGARAFQ